MTQLSALTAFAVASVAAFLGVAALRRYAIRTELLDVPNERSSHVTTTPRGGGLPLIGAAWLAVAVTVSGDPAWHEVVNRRSLLLAATATAIVAWIGWCDDRGGVSVRVRLLVHLVAALMVAPLVVGAIEVPAWSIPLLAASAIFWTMSAINVINFMDGIDGLIGGTMVVFALHVWSTTPTTPSSVFAAALAGASAGFLLWNWNPARVFMGDVGSGALGVMVTAAAAFALHDQARTGMSASAGAREIVSMMARVIAMLLPLAPMFSDAAITIFRRWRRSERLSQAHRSHLYQRLANGGLGHARTSALYIAAAAAGAVAARGGTALMLAYLILLVVVGVVLERAGGRR